MLSLQSSVAKDFGNDIYRRDAVGPLRDEQKFITCISVYVLPRVPINMPDVDNQLDDMQQRRSFLSGRSKIETACKKLSIFSHDWADWKANLSFIRAKFMKRHMSRAYTLKRVMIFKNLLRRNFFWWFLHFCDIPYKCRTGKQFFFVFEDQINLCFAITP